MDEQKTITVLYHSGCPDGFGAAYAAWKKFGETANYVPMSYGDALPEGVEGHELYLVDFCYETTEEIEQLLKTTKRLIVLDHHQSNKPYVESVPEHIFDINHSGATIAWKYFHPEVPTPRLLTYLEDGDLYHFKYPETEKIFSYLMVLGFDFAKWEALVLELEDEEKRSEVLRKADAYTEFFDALVKMSVERAKKVRFEGYEVYFSATHPHITMRSRVVHDLYVKHPPFAINVTAHPDGYGVSLRGDGTIDLAKIAEKYGGGGHHDAAGLFIPNGSEIPWVEIEN